MDRTKLKLLGITAGWVLATAASGALLSEARRSAEHRAVRLAAAAVLIGAFVVPLGLVIGAGVFTAAVMLTDSGGSPSV